MADLQKELKIRRRIESIFNKAREDFSSLKEFGDYEEQREDIIFNLAQGIDVEAQEAKVAAYQKQNYEEIIRNEAKKAESKRQKIEEQAPKPEPSTKQPEEAVAAEPNIAVHKPALDQPSVLPPAPAVMGGDARMQDNDVAPEPGGQADRTPMGLASGWSPDLPVRRALQEAYSTIF